MKKFVYILLLAAPLLLAGCGNKSGEKWLDTGHVYDSPEEKVTSRLPDPVTEEALPEEKPIFKVIRGSKVAGKEEAEEKLLGPGCRL